jgi:hypothetical protein
MYRTLNQEAEFFFVDDVRNNAEQLYHTSVSGTGATAPSSLASVTFPAPNARVCAVFKDCVFLDGGRDQSSTLFFSNPGRPDQYAALDYITLDGKGGEVTGLYAYNAQ